MADKGWRAHPDVDLEEINADLQADLPTVDVAYYYPDNLDAAHHEKVDVELLVHGHVKAKEVFGEVGVQLRMSRFNTGSIDSSLFSMMSSKSGRETPSSRYTNMYVQAERHPTEISDAALRACESAIGDVAGSDRTVHILTLQEVYIEWMEPVVEHRVFQAQTIETSGLSFPGYMHGDTIPRAYRGLITITNLRRNETSWKTIAHELGHKLMNVSHEYRDTSPAHEVLADGGLMLYGEGVEIPAGEEGRFHYERLHRSPYIYRNGPDGERIYNPDYADRGFYYDPIYDGVSVEF